MDMQRHGTYVEPVQRHADARTSPTTPSPVLVADVPRLAPITLRTGAGDPGLHGPAGPRGEAVLVRPGNLPTPEPDSSPRRRVGRVKFMSAVSPLVRSRARRAIPSVIVTAGMAASVVLL